MIIDQKCINILCLISSVWSEQMAVNHQVIGSNPIWDSLFKIKIMEDFKTRLITEQKELEEKLTKLNTFNEGEKVKELDSVQRTLLLIQAGAMYTYNECLKGRIALL